MQGRIGLRLTMLMLQTKIVPCRKASVTVLLMALMPTHQGVETDMPMVSEEAVRLVDASV